MAQLKEAGRKVTRLASIKTPPFITVVMSIYGVIGIVLLGFGIHMLLEDRFPKHGWAVVIAAGTLIVVSWLGHSLYPRAYRWLNK